MNLECWSKRGKSKFSNRNARERMKWIQLERGDGGKQGWRAMAFLLSWLC